MRVSLLAALLAMRGAQKKTVLARPFFIVRNDDGKYFYRQPDGTYVNDEDQERLPLYLTQQIVADAVTGYALSIDEAPDFHSTSKETPHFLIGGHAS